MDTIDTTACRDIHYGITYDRASHVERDEPIYANPSNLWRISECPASALKINRQAPIAGLQARGLMADHLVAEAMAQGAEIRDVARPNTLPQIIEDAEKYLRILRKLIGNREYRIEVLLQGDYIPGFTGIADCIVYDSDKQTLMIVDHKTGTNSRYAADNLQLRCYAVMALKDAMAAGKPIQSISLTVVQPDAADPVRSNKHTVSEVLDWDKQIRSIIRYAADHLDEANPDPYRCMYCPYNKSCHALQAYNDDNHAEFEAYKARIQAKYGS